MPEDTPLSGSPGAGPDGDLARLRGEYAAREERLAGSDRYSPFNPAQLFLLQQRERALLRLLRRRGFYPLDRRQILEVGCGSGQVLLDFLGYGAAPERLHGIDLLPARLARARAILPRSGLAGADGQRLPYASASFDLVLQYTAFSSVLDDAVRRRMAGEILRVVRRPGGLVVWYDFWLNPVNRQTRGIGPAEIRRLFPGCRYAFQRVTLAPPLARRLVPISWGLSCLLERAGWLNSHYLVALW